MGERKIKMPTGEERIIRQFWPSEKMDRIRDFPEITSAPEHHQAIAKLIALGWVLGYPFGWPIRSPNDPPFPKKNYPKAEGNISDFGSDTAIIINQ